MARAVGIDLGTTNSVVAVLEGGEPTVIANAAKSLMVAPLGDKLDANANRPAGQVQVDFGPMTITRLGAGAHRGQ